MRPAIFTELSPIIIVWTISISRRKRESLDKDDTNNSQKHFSTNSRPLVYCDNYCDAVIYALSLRHQIITSPCRLESSCQCVLKPLQHSLYDVFAKKSVMVGSNCSKNTKYSGHCALSWCMLVFPSNLLSARAVTSSMCSRIHVVVSA